MKKRYFFKILIFGESGVGKTTLLHRLKTGEFNKNIKTTIGVDFLIYNISFQDNDFTLSFWDIAGNEQFKSLLSSYCNGTSAAILAFDLNDLSTIDQFDFWVNTLHQYIKDIPILLIGTKCDLKINPMFTKNKIEDLQNIWGFFDYLQTSSKDGSGVKPITDLLLTTILKQNNDKGLNIFGTK